MVRLYFLEGSSIFTCPARARHTPHAPHPTCTLPARTPCSSSLSSCSGTLGELAACRRHWMLSSGTTYSRTSLRGRPRAVPCRAVEGTASSRIAPRRVVSWANRRQLALAAEYSQGPNSLANGSKALYLKAEEISPLSTTAPQWDRETPGGHESEGGRAKLQQKP